MTPQQAQLTPEEVTGLLMELTRDILERMATQGWYRGDRRTQEMPTVWDINCGACEDWADAAQELVGGDVFWLEDIDPDYWRLSEEEAEDFAEMSHCVLYREGLWYDSQSIHGVSHPRELPLVQCVPRESYEPGDIGFWRL